MLCCCLLQLPMPTAANKPSCNYPATLAGLPLPSFPQHSVSVRYATEHRCGVVVRGPGLTDAISGTDPLRDGLPLQDVVPTNVSPEAAHTAAVVTELSAEMQRVLRQHSLNAERTRQGKAPANAVLLRGCGSRRDTVHLHTSTDCVPSDASCWHGLS